MKIGSRKICATEAPLVIAEIGINHGGDVDVAKSMIEAAHRAGVEVVKLQTHVVEDEMSLTAKNVIPGNADRSIYEIMAESALSLEEEVELKSYIESLGMIFLSTPFSRAAALRLRDMNVSAFKIGSGECNNLPLIDLVASFGKPMIVSTGMNDMTSIRNTKKILDDRNVEYCFLHTTNLYPTPPHLVRLGAMEEMMAEFPGVEIGLSDHTTSNLACFAAVALGANVVERHFTDTMDRVGPDIVNSMDETACSELILGVEAIRSMRGGSKQAAPEEQVTMDFAFATVVTTRPVRAGDFFSEKNIWVKRPGTGEIAASDYRDLLGRKCNKSIPVDHHVRWEEVD